MADDIKSLAKKNTDLEKRLKLAEARIKVLSDSLTSTKDIDKMLDVLHKKMSADQNLTSKDLKREIELSDKLRASEAKEYDKENDKIRKEMDKMNKTYVREAEMTILKNRLSTVEALVHAALKK